MNPIPEQQNLLHPTDIPQQNINIIEQLIEQPINPQKPENQIDTRNK